MTLYFAGKKVTGVDADIKGPGIVSREEIERGATQWWSCNNCGCDVRTIGGYDPHQRCSKCGTDLGPWFDHGGDLQW